MAMGMVMAMGMEMVMAMVMAVATVMEAGGTTALRAAPADWPTHRDRAAFAV
jgi:hypothetical protein